MNYGLPTVPPEVPFEYRFGGRCQLVQPGVRGTSRNWSRVGRTGGGGVAAVPDAEVPVELFDELLATCAAVCPVV